MESEQFKSDLVSIRKMMERSAKFISLSGLSGIMAGIYAVLGAAWIYYKTEQTTILSNAPILWVGVMVLLLAVGTAVLLSARKAQAQRQSLWNPASKALLQSVSIPLITGGILLLICYQQQRLDLLVPMALLFYGLALAVGSLYTYKDVWGLGIAQIILGLAAFAIDGYDLIFWSFGFGLLHILYGAIMFVKYDRK
jgi:FtsH-binding integral membrane protein